MAGDESGGTWPRPQFRFAVDIEGVGTGLLFQEVSGLDAEAQPIEYRAGQSRNFSTVKLPGITKFGNVTLKRGVFASDSRLFDWYARIRANTVERTSITIRLLDESGHTTMAWQLSNAWPAKVSASDLNAAGNEVAIESLELAHEGLTIANG